jgi:DNA topoisomerase VI subunit B
MNILKINDIEYDMSSPSGLEFKNKYITSFGDKIPPLVNVIWHHVNGFYLELKTNCEDSFVVEIIDNGIGIKPEDISKLFLEFNKLDE